MGHPMPPSPAGRSRPTISRGEATEPWCERGGLADRTGLRVSAPVGQVVAPVFREPTPTLEQICAAIGRLVRGLS